MKTLPNWHGPQHRNDVLRHVRVQPGRRLVAEEEGWVGEDFAGKSESLELSSGYALKSTGHPDQGVRTLGQSQLLDHRFHAFHTKLPRNLSLHADQSLEAQGLSHAESTDEEVVLLDVAGHGGERIRGHHDAVGVALAWDELE